LDTPEVYHSSSLGPLCQPAILVLCVPSNADHDSWGAKLASLLVAFYGTSIYPPV
jgi:hypothetical protein